MRTAAALAGSAGWPLCGAFALGPGIGGRRVAWRVAREAGVSRRAVREDAHRVAGDGDLYLAAYELGMGAVLERARVAAETERDWVGRVRAALGALLDELARRPALAGACAAVEARADDPRVRARRERLAEPLGALLSPAGAGGGEASAAALADGVLETVGRTVRESSPAALPGLLVQLQWWAVAAGSR